MGDQFIKIRNKRHLSLMGQFCPIRTVTTGFTGTKNGKNDQKEPSLLDKEEIMILVLLGTQNNSFHRLLEEVEKNIKDKTINEEVIVQAGYTKYQSDKMKIIDLMSKEQLSKFQDEASLIITHGGVGSIVSSIEKGKKVIAVPRKHEYGEHVNNHQEEIVKDFNSKGYIIGIENVEDLKQAIIKVKDFKPKKYKPNNQKILHYSSS